MFEVRIVGRQPQPAYLDFFGLTYDVNADRVRFVLPQPRADVFDRPGLQVDVNWITPYNATGRSALTLAPQGADLVGEWKPPEQMLLVDGEARAELRCYVDDGTEEGKTVWHSLPLRLSIVKSIEDTSVSLVEIPKYKAVGLEVNTLPSGSEASGSVTHGAERLDFTLNIPVMKGDPGEPGRITFAAFSVRNGQLYVTLPDVYAGPWFVLEKGRLGVAV